MNENSGIEFYHKAQDKTLSIEVTTYCNSACLHCFASNGASKRYSLSIDLVKKIIAEGYDNGYRRLHITGGEPLLWEGLFEALDFTFEMGYKAAFINTNGTLLTKATSLRLAAYDSLSMSVSLDGIEGLHDCLRGEGSYRQTLAGIGKALAAGIDLFVFTIARKTLLPEIPYFANEVYTSFPSIKDLTLIQLVRVTEGPFPLSEELLEPGDFVGLVKMVSLLNLCGLRTSMLNDPLASTVSKVIGMPWVPQAEPEYGLGSLIIMADRSMGVSHSSKYRFGKFELGMIKRVLASAKYRNVVAADKTRCPSCKYFRLCVENGMVRPSESYSRMDADALFCETVLSMIT